MDYEMKIPDEYYGTTCRRFELFIKHSKPGTYIFKGDLFGCKPDTNGMNIIVDEITCDNNINNVTNSSNY